jgi:hypothetical protein
VHDVEIGLLAQQAGDDPGIKVLIGGQSSHRYWRSRSARRARRCSRMPS